MNRNQAKAYNEETEFSVEQRSNITHSEQYLFRKEDFMDKMKSRVGYSFVPIQRMDKVYSPSKALMAGTIFPELNITIDEYERGLYNGK